MSRMVIFQQLLIIYIFNIFDFFSKCESGCLNCIEKPCEVCNLSEWSEWKNISSNCKINSKRFRNYFGRNCSNKKIEEQIKTYHNNCTCFYNNTNYQVYIFTFIYLKYSLDTWTNYIIKLINTRSRAIK